MDTVQDILIHSLQNNRDAVKASVDSVMSARVADHINNMTVDYASSLLSASTGTEEMPQVEQSLESTEETPDENV